MSRVPKHEGFEVGPLSSWKNLGREAHPAFEVAGDFWRKLDLETVFWSNGSINTGSPGDTQFSVFLIALGRAGSNKFHRGVTLPILVQWIWVKWRFGDSRIGVNAASGQLEKFLAL